MQERYFGTFFQRVLAAPLDVRFHYGHPDLLDKLHFLTRGGVSKASKEINLSEDVFAGYKTTLHGGRVVFREYHQLGKGRMTNLSEISAFFGKLAQGAACQVMSRDLYRLCKALPIDRQLSTMHGAFGFYLINAVTMHLVQFTAYLLALLNLSGLLPYFSGTPVTLNNLAVWMPAFASLVLMVPDALMVAHERGMRVAVNYLFGKLLTLAPLYYIFIAQTRAYHFANTMRWGGADYFRTNRAVAIAHTPFHELYLSYAHSHFYPAADMLALLTVAFVSGVTLLVFWQRRQRSGDDKTNLLLSALARLVAQVGLGEARHGAHLGLAHVQRHLELDDGALERADDVLVLAPDAAPVVLELLARLEVVGLVHKVVVILLFTLAVALFITTALPPELAERLEAFFAPHREGFRMLVGRERIASTREETASWVCERMPSRSIVF